MLKQYTLNDCSLGKHLFWKYQDSRKTKQMFPKQMLREQSLNAFLYSINKINHNYWIFPLSNVTRDSVTAMFTGWSTISRCWQAREQLIWTHPRDLDLANESAHYITIDFLCSLNHLFELSSGFAALWNSP